MEVRNGRVEWKDIRGIIQPAGMGKPSNPVPGGYVSVYCTDCLHHIGYNEVLLKVPTAEVVRKKMVLVGHQEVIDVVGSDAKYKEIPIYDSETKLIPLANNGFGDAIFIDGSDAIDVYKSIGYHLFESEPDGVSDVEVSKTWRSSLSFDPEKVTSIDILIEQSEGDVGFDPRVVQQHFRKNHDLEVNVLFNQDFDSKIGNSGEEFFKFRVNYVDGYKRVQTQEAVQQESHWEPIYQEVEEKFAPLQIITK